MTSTLPRSSPKRSKKPVVRLRIPLHSGQRVIKDHPARFKLVACGRQWGKTRLGCPYAFKEALEGKRIWIVGPDYPRAQIDWRIVKGFARQIPFADIRESEKRIEFPNGGFLEVKSAHGDDRLRGPTLDGVVVDEAAFMSEEKWTKELRATLSVRKGWALFLSTFDGENWYYDLYQRGQESDPDWQSWRHPSVDNPYISEAEIEEARRELPEAVFAQEYEADPISYAGAVFKGRLVQLAVDRGAAALYREDLPAYAGLDWGYSNLTALEVCQEDAEGRVSWIDEATWKATELNQRCRAIAEICERYGIRMIAADAAGATEIRTLAETLTYRGLETVVQPVPFGKFKQAGIDTRRWYLENDSEALGPKCALLTQNTKRYRYQEGTENVVKEDDHTVDAVTAFYATRADRLVGGRR